MKDLIRYAFAAALTWVSCESVFAEDAKPAADVDVAATLAALVENSVLLKAGVLKMGDAAVKNASPVHDVQLRAFAIGKYLVTRGEFAAFISDSNYDAGSAWRKPLFKQTERDPVVNVSWFDAQAFAVWLSQKTQQKFRLPTEAEWEYAARAGTSTKYYWGDDIGKNQANCNNCDSRWDGDSTAPVGSFAANPWGLFDIAGNTAEWTQDCFREDYKQAPADGSAWVGDGKLMGDGKYRIARGGSWSDPATNMGSAFRDPNMSDFRYTNIGFRLVRELE